MPHESKQRVHSPPSTQRQRSLSAPAEATGAQRRRRTFTTNQFNYVWRPSYQRNAGEAFGRKRPSSPNRHHNPHPLGLATQEPYNKDNAVSDQTRCAIHTLHTILRPCTNYFISFSTLVQTSDPVVPHLPIMRQMCRFC